MTPAEGAGWAGVVTSCWSHRWTMTKCSFHGADKYNGWTDVPHGSHASVTSAPSPQRGQLQVPLSTPFWT